MNDSKSDKSTSDESASLASGFSFDLGSQRDLMSMLFPDRSSKLKLSEWQRAWSIVSRRRERIGKPMHSLARNRAYAWRVYIYAQLYTPEAGGGGGGIRSAYKRIGGNGVSELAAS